MITFTEYLQEAKTPPFDIKPVAGSKPVDPSLILHPSSEKNMGSTSLILQVNPSGWKDFVWLVTESSYATKNKKWKFTPAEDVDRGIAVSNISKKQLTFADFKKEMGATLKKFGMLNDVILSTVKYR